LEEVVVAATATATAVGVVCGGLKWGFFLWKRKTRDDGEDGMSFSCKNVKK